MKIFADAALLPDGWAHGVEIDIDAGGAIATVRHAAAPADAERLRGPVIPGMANVHSHAFQRALAGRTGMRSNSGDSFWTWRQAMYAFLDQVDADAFEAVAAQAYIEMLKAGYTTVAEFHYVHRDPRGAPYADPAELARRIVAAAADAGIGLTLLPVFYAHSGFGGAPPSHGQRRFISTIEGYERLVETLQPGADAKRYVLGVAPHSLRAVNPDELCAVVALAGSRTPVHIHAAEQMREVDECVAWSGARPVRWLLDHCAIDARWCIVHATHQDAGEVRDLAATGAVAGLASTTEADLGDGTFPARAWQDAKGAFGVGTDSNTIIDPFAELRQLEWSQRLAQRARNVLGYDDVPVGQFLYAHAASGGAQAVDSTSGAIAAGRRADLVVLDTGEPALASQRADALIDAAIFGPCRRPVRDVMVGGRWVVRDGVHALEEIVFARYRATLEQMAVQ